MKYRILLVFTFLIIINTIVDSYGERDVTIEKTNLKIDIFRKIDSVIQKWQSSADPVAFAQENNLAYSDVKIRVYIYLDKPESISKLPQEINVTSSADNIVSAYLDSQQITQTAQMDFVQRIGLPILATHPPIPAEISNDNGKSVLSEYSYYAIIIAVSAIIAGIVFFAKRRNKKSMGQKP